MAPYLPLVPARYGPPAEGIGAAEKRKRESRARATANQLRDGTNEELPRGLSLVVLPLLIE